MSEGKVYIGTSGFSYRHWADGVFYPPGLPARQWLEFYTEHFNTVELNASFYRLPKTEYFDRWAKTGPTDFRWTVKASRIITHLRKLKDCDEPLQRFFETVIHLKQKLAVVLFQLPPSLRRDDELLGDFLELLMKRRPKRTLRVVFEFRNDSWLCEPIYELLSRHGVAICLADMPRCTCTEPNEARFVYIRRHGPGGTYGGCYSKQHLSADARRIRRYLRRGRDVYVYFNNDAHGYAVKNAHSLQQLLQK